MRVHLPQNASRRHQVLLAFFLSLAANLRPSAMRVCMPYAVRDTGSCLLQRPDCSVRACTPHWCLAFAKVGSELFSCLPRTFKLYEQTTDIVNQRVLVLNEADDQFVPCFRNTVPIHPLALPETRNFTQGAWDSRCAFFARLPHLGPESYLGPNVIYLKGLSREQSEYKSGSYSLYSHLMNRIRSVLRFGGLLAPGGPTYMGVALCGRGG